MAHLVHRLGTPASAGTRAAGFGDLLHEQGVRGRDARIAIALVVAKMLHPSSEREALRWLREDSAALELLDLDRGKALSLQKLYRTGDVLWRHRRALQAGLFRRERELLELPDTIVFYDLTNTWYTGRQDKKLLRFGRSKERRNNCPLVTLALSLDGAGFPRGCEVLAGDVSEPSTLKAALERFEAEAGSGEGPKPTVVVDAGIATEANIGWLRERGYDWLREQGGASGAAGGGCRAHVDDECTAGGCGVEAGRGRRGAGRGAAVCMSVWRTRLGTPASAGTRAAGPQSA